MNSSDIVILICNLIVLFALGFCFYSIYTNLFVTVLFAAICWSLMRRINYYVGVR